MNKKVLITLTLFAVVYWALFDFLRWSQFDSSSFIGGARLLFGLDGGFNFQSRLSKPLILFLPGITEMLTTLHPKYVFLFQNIIFFYLCGIYIYKINLIIFNDSKLAYLGMLAYITCQPFAVFSLFILSDVAGWFFGILGIYLTLKYFSKPIVKLKDIALTGFLIGLGCLTKESAIIGFIFLASYILINKNHLYRCETGLQKINPVSSEYNWILNSFAIANLSRTSINIKAKQLLVSIGAFIIPIAISFILINHFFGDSISKRIIEAHNVTQQDKFAVSNLKQIFRVIDMYWFVFAIGLISAIKILSNKDNNHQLKSILLTGLITALLIPVWPYLLDRILFLVAPILIIITVYGLKLLKQYALPLVLIAGTLNISITFVIYKYQINGALLDGVIAFIMIAVVFGINLKKPIPEEETN